MKKHSKKPDLFVRRSYPCKDCEFRTVGCHSTCDRYIGAKKDCEESNANSRFAKRSDKDFEDYVYRRTEKIQNSKKRRK